MDHDFVHLREEWDWIPGVPETLKHLHDSGFKLIVVTNQSGIARGRFTLDDVNRLHQWVNQRLSDEMGITIDAFYVAPWHPGFHKNHNPILLHERKPGTVLFERAAERFDIDFKQSFMAGDKSSDIKPALKLGMKPVLVKSRFTDEKLLAWAKRKEVSYYSTINEAVRGLNLRQK